MMNKQFNYEKEYKKIKSLIEEEKFESGLNYIDQLDKENVILKIYLIVLKGLILNKLNKFNEHIAILKPIELEIFLLNDPFVHMDYIISFADTLWKSGKQSEGMELIENIESDIEKYKVTLSRRGRIPDSIIEREADLRNIKGIIYWLLGEVLKSQLAFRETLTLRGILGNKRLFAMSLNNLGNIYVYRGELEIALDHHLQSLEIRREIQNQNDIATSLGNIGEIYHYQGNYDQALVHYNEAIEFFDSLNNKLFLAKICYQIITLAVEYDNKTLGKEHLEKLKQIKESVDKHPYIETILTLSEGLILKTSDRLLDKLKAGDLFQKIANSQIVDHELTIQAILNLTDILLIEVRFSNNEEVLQEVKDWADKIMDLAESQRSSVLLIQNAILRSKLKLLDFQVETSKKLLKNAQDIAIRTGIYRFDYYISHELDLLLQQEEKWMELQDRGASIQERLDLTGLEETINSLIRIRDVKIEIEHEEPVLFIILTDGGLSIFSTNFTELNIDSQLIAGFISAVNSFGQQIFLTEGSIERIKHGEYTLISKKVNDSITFCYAFKGASYMAVKKFDKLISTFNSSKFRKIIMSNIRRGLLLSDSEEIELKNLVSVIIEAK